MSNKVVTIKTNMFKKLLSNLPYNPSLIGQVSFYANRLHSEEKIRRLGLFFVALSLVVQVFATVSPPEKSLAQSSNDILAGGFSSKADAVTKCNQNTQGFKTILAHYAVTCEQLHDTATTTTITSNAADYDSMGRLPQGPVNSRTGKQTGEYPVAIGGVTYYMRDLRSWDTGASSRYQVLKVKNAHGQTIMIMYDCGNIVTVGRYEPPKEAQSPGVEVQAMACDGVNRRNFFGGYAFDGDRPTKSLAVTLFIDNTQIGDYTASVSRPDVNDYFKITGSHGFEINVTHASAYDGKTHTAYVVAKGVDAAGRQDGKDKRSNTVSFGPCLPKTTTPVPPTPPPSQPPAEVTPQTPIDACPYIGGIQTDESQCKPCEAATGADATPCLALSKTARNNTQEIANANNTTAKGGDTITYTLTTKNTGNVRIEDYVVEENVGDILDYADITDMNGATLGDDKVVRWPAADIAAGNTLTRKLSVKIKNPIPQTNMPSVTSGSFDLVMTNVYGNTVNIKLPGSPAKITEMTTTQSLPNTGPGETVGAVVAFTVFVSYFYARTRLLAKETDIVRTDYATTGGY